MVNPFSSSLASQYALLAVNAEIITGSESYAVRAIDFTDGINATPGEVDVNTLAPVAAVRTQQLDALGVEQADLIGGTIIINGMSWEIVDYKERHHPRGRGELMLILRELADSE